MSYRRHGDLPSITRRFSQSGGLHIVVIPGTQAAGIELQMAPEDGATGDPDATEATTVGYLNASMPFLDLDLPVDGDKRFFRARHVGKGGDPSDWTPWSTGKAPGERENGDGDAIDHGDGGGGTSGGKGRLNLFRLALDHWVAGYGAGLPKVLAVVPHVTASGAVSVTVKTQDAGSVKIAHSTSGYPTAATVRDENEVTVDSEGNYASDTIVNLDPGQAIYLSILAYSEADGTGSESVLAKGFSDEHTEVIYGTTTVKHGFASSRNTDPGTGVTVTADGGYAYCELQDANIEETTYRVYYDIDPTGITYLCTVTVWYSTAATGGSWVEADSKTYDSLSALTDECIEVVQALDAEYDIRIGLSYSNPGTDDGNASLTCPAETDTPGGVEFTKKTTRVSSAAFVFPVGADQWATE